MSELELTKKQMRNIETFITTSMFLADRLWLTPEETISATLIIQKRCARKMGYDLKGLTQLLKEFIDNEDNISNIR